MKTVTEASIGEILYDATETELITPFRGFKQIKPTLYASLYPMDVSDYEDLKLSLERLCLSDPSVVVEKCTSHALGLGWRIGFLGMLHMEVGFKQCSKFFLNSFLHTYFFSLALKKFCFLGI